MGFAPTWLRQVSPLLHKTTDQPPFLLTPAVSFYVTTGMYMPLDVDVGRKFRDRVDLERIRQLEETMQTTLETIARDAGKRRKINAGLRVPNRCPRPAPPIGLPAPVKRLVVGLLCLRAHRVEALSDALV